MALTDAKHIVVTGANRGLGRLLSDHLMENGYKVALCVRSDKDIEESQRKLVDSTCSTYVLGDLTVSEDLGRITTEIKKWSGGRIDGLINNAGIAHGGLIQTSRVSDIKDIFNINLFSVIDLTQRLHRYLRRAPASSIVNVSSVSSISLDQGQIAYGVSKAALNAVTKVMAREYAEQNISVNAILPAVLDVGMASEMSEKALKAQLSQMAVKDVIPANDVVSLVVYLLESAGKSLTGQLLRLDKGMVL
jgi:3-oxoacyl-[acyl-carrier protein] reductase